MAYENIQFKYPNFCHGAQDGTFCSVNQDVATTIMRIKNSTGGLISDYTLSSNILNDVLHLEYTGPMNLTQMIDSVTFFTVEKVSSSTCIIKRWETRPSSNQLNLKQQIIKSTGGSYYYDINSAAIENYRTSFSEAMPAGSNYIKLNSFSRITTGTKIFLGPSNDADNEGATETVTVSSISSGKIYLTSNLVYDYVIGDSACFYKNIYLFSNIGIGGDTSRGAVFKINAYTGNVDDVNTDKVYRNIQRARWCSQTDAIASISSNNLMFVKPYNSYLNWKSIFLNNIANNNYDTFDVKDILFAGANGIYKLQNKMTLRDDNGGKNTYDWGSLYNYMQDTLLPYTNSIQIYTDKAYMIGANNTTTLYIKVIDQFGVGLRDKTVNVSIESGDIAAELSPLNGQVTTDLNGEANVGYTSGTSYTGKTVIKCKVDGSSTFTGSQYVWDELLIFSEIEVDPPIETKLFQLKEVESINNNLIKQVETEITINILTFGKTFFTTPGGDWINPSRMKVEDWIPGLVIGEDDGPNGAGGGGFSAPGPPFKDPSKYNMKPNQITQVVDFDSDNDIRQLGNFKIIGTEWDDVAHEWKKVFIEPYFSLYGKEGSGELQFSQLKGSDHTFWTGGVAYDYLWTYVNTDQFIFVEDAIPKFWSEKNPISTDIWIRLRPFAYSLNALSLTYKIREVWSDGDTNWVDVSSSVSYQYFDAGGGVLGVELTYNPPQDFHYDSLIYIDISLYDTAPTPNLINTAYWFTVIPDYKSPYLDNLSPSREQSFVAIDSNVYYEIKDLGAGVDIDSLEMTVNSRRVIPTVTKINNNYYKVNYNPSKNFYYDKRITITVKVDDLSDNDNWLNDKYSFYTVESDDLIFTLFEPGICKKGLPRFQDVSFVALSTGNGINDETLRLQIYGKDVTDESNIVPVIYRLS